MKKRVRLLHPGEQWFEVIDYFEPGKIRSVTSHKGVFVLGNINDVMLVQVPATLSQEQLQGLQRDLAAANMAALIVSDNVRFVKLRVCEYQEGRTIDEHIAAQEAEDARAKSEQDRGTEVPPEDSGSGPGPS